MVLSGAASLLLSEKIPLLKRRYVEEHVYRIIQTMPNDRVAEWVQRLKGEMSWVTRKEYPELEEFL